MRRDFLIAIILGLATVPFGASMMVAPEYLHLKGSALGLTFWGGAALSTVLIVVAVTVALRGDAQSPPKGHRGRMLAIIGMAVCGFGFMASAIWFYLARPSAQIAEVERPSVLLLPSENQLQLHNKGTKDFYIWGTKFAAQAPAMEHARRTVPAGHFYYFLTDRINQDVLQVIGQNGDKLEPFKVYIEDSAGTLFVANFELLIAVKQGLVSIHTQQLGVEQSNWRDSIQSEKLTAEIKQISPLVEALRQSQNALAESERAKNLVARILAQYDQLKSGITGYEQFAGRGDEKERTAAAEHIFKELRAVLGDVQSIQTTQGQSLMIKTGPNTFRVTFPVPMRIAPRVSFHNLPAGAIPNLTERSPLGFTVVFAPPTVPVETFGYTADAEL